jgi:signal recognition particle GTPase
MVIVIASSKGGSGKTTTTIHLAVCAQLAGETVAIVDCDPQGSALAWASAREAAEPIVAGAEPRDIAKALAKARSAGCSTIVVDTQPRGRQRACNTSSARRISSSFRSSRRRSTSQRVKARSEWSKPSGSRSRSSCRAARSGRPTSRSAV